MVNAIKRAISKGITHPLVGRAIALFYKRVSYFGIQISLENPLMSFANKAAVFWNLYESAEARLIKQFMRSDLPVIELGSSLGVISRLIGFHVKAPLICIEANKGLIPSIEMNLNDLPHLVVKTLNRAISYGNEPVRFSANVGENLTGKVNRNFGEFVDSITLNEIVELEGFTDFALVMDIEGSEIEIFINDIEILQNCKLMILEVHETEYQGKQYSIEAIRELIEDAGFSLLKRDGNCFAYNRDLI